MSARATPLAGSTSQGLGSALASARPPRGGHWLLAKHGLYRCICCGEMAEGAWRYVVDAVSYADVCVRCAERSEQR